MKYLNLEKEQVDVEITEEGFIVTKSKKKKHFPYKETDLLKGLSAETAHSDLLASPQSKEVGQ